MTDMAGTDAENRSDRKRRRGSWLRHAFAVEDAASFEPTDEQREMVDDVCRWMVKRGLTTAALIGVEMHRPANYIVANIMHFFRPAVSVTLLLMHLLPIVRRALPDMRRYRAFAEMIEHRGAADFFIRRLEQIEAENAEPDMQSTPSREHDEQDRS